MSKLTCVANPKSQNGTVAAKADILHDFLTSRNIDHNRLDLTATGFEEQLLDMIKNGEVSTILGIGGDGTHHSLLNILQHIAATHPQVQLPDYALCPLGTGNDIAKSIGLRTGVRNYDHVVETALQGDRKAVDLGCWNGRYFADMISVGMDATVLSKRELMTSHLRKRPILNKCLHGYIIYALAGATVMASRQGRHVKIRLDGKDWYEGPVCGILINNCAVHAGEFILTPDARMDDGRLDLMILTNRFQYIARMVRGWRHLPEAVGRHHSSRLTQAKTINIELDKPTAVQIDGEPAELSRSLNISVKPGAVQMRVPTV